MAPLEGITGPVYRNAYHNNFTPADKYFTPFIQSKGLNHRDKENINPDNNKGLYVVPQILAGDIETFLEIANQIEHYGYKEVNLNLGCPYGTVVSKKHGAGFLSEPDRLDAFLYEAFDKCPMELSIKTRIGMESVNEWENLVKIYNKYKACEIIIHPRLRKDFYNNEVNIDAYRYAYQILSVPVGYNGDIKTKEDYERIINIFPDTDSIMIGRGLIANPFIIDIINGKETDLNKLKCFHNELLEGYKSVMSGDMNTLFKLKEMWSYMKELFDNGDRETTRLFKRIKKATRLEEYEACVRELFGVGLQK